MDRLADAMNDGGNLVPLADVTPSHRFEISKVEEQVEAEDDGEEPEHKDHSDNDQNVQVLVLTAQLPTHLEETAKQGMHLDSEFQPVKESDHEVDSSEG